LKPPELHQRRALAGAEFDATVGDEIERGDAARRPAPGDCISAHQADAVAETDVPGALRAGREEYFRGGGVRIFSRKMVLASQAIVDAELVGEFDLIERPPETACARRPRSTAAEAGVRRKCRIMGAPGERFAQKPAST